MSPQAASRLLPIVEELPTLPEPDELFRRLAALPHALWLDSAMRDAKLGRYSFLAADPFEYFEFAAEDRDSLGELTRKLAPYRAEAVPELPPFQGGAAGLLSYDLGRQLERLPRPAFDEFGLPAMAVGLYDVVIAIDHVSGRNWIISQGFPELEPGPRQRRAAARLAQVRQWIERPVAARRVADQGDLLSASQLAPQFATSGPPGLTSNFSRERYLAAVRRAIDYICAGDMFEVNLAQRLLMQASCPAAELYLRLRRCNPAPFAGYFDLGKVQVVSASPERFLSVRDRMVETRPIKGTRPRHAEAEADHAVAQQLQASGKDRAENVMIVDLLRNDLSRCCEPDSVRVSQLCGLETYAHVHHLVSAVRGRLRTGLTPIDLIRAAFPGGSVTGAPKIRAMEIIAELEPTARGPYCGSLGYLGFDGTMDLNILIRTITAARGWWQTPVGGAVVAQSDPAQEYEETWHKAQGMLQAMTGESLRVEQIQSFPSP